MSQEPASPPTARVALVRALHRRCPRCGAPGLFQSRFRLAERCSRCALVFRREDGAMTGQMYLSAAVTELFAALLIAAIWLGTDWGPGRSIAVSVPLAAAFAYAFLPVATALWAAIEYLTDVANGEPWTRAAPADPRAAPLREARAREGSPPPPSTSAHGGDSRESD